MHAGAVLCRFAALNVDMGKALADWRIRLHPKRGVAQDGKATEVNTAAQLAATHFHCVPALCEYQVSPVPLENALRSDELQCQPVGVAAGFAADRLAHHLHIEEICRAETRAQLRRYRAGDIACRRQPGPDRAHGEKSPLLA